MSKSAAALRIPEHMVFAASRHASAVKSEYRVVVRARIVRDAVAGVSNEENARRNGVRPDTVRKWRARAESAMSEAEAFADAPRSGRRARISLETRATVIRIACTRPAPELSKARVRARTNEARAARTAAIKAKRRAEASARQAARQEVSARRRHQRDEVREATTRRRNALRAAKGASKALVAAEVKLSDARADAARAVKGSPAAFSSVWSGKTLQAELKRQTGETMSLSEIRRILRCGGLRPHRVRIWLHSPDPEFQVKVRALCALYLNPPAGAVVLSIDEKTGMQARADLHPIHTSMHGAARREFEYIRNGTSTLIAAFNIRTGEVFGRCWRRTAEGLVRFLDELAMQHPKGDVYIVWDNLNVHKGPAIEAFNARHGGRFHFVHTPLHASWMNQVEIWFSILQRRVLRHGSFASKADLEAAVMAFIRQWNAVERRPFRWRFRGEFAPRLPWAPHAEADRRRTANELPRRAA